MRATIQNAGGVSDADCRAQMVPSPANGQLLATAPKLLKTLRKMVEMARSPDFDGALSDAVLAEAESVLREATTIDPRE